MIIPINSEYFLDSIRLEDAPRLAEVINDEEIANNTLTIPFPYKLEDAQWWINTCIKQEEKRKVQCQWAIRNATGQMCGAIGLHHKYGGESHKDEFGYWLMRPLWNKGLMTETIRVFSNFCFSNRGLARLEAPVFLHNKGSARVLEKVGFKLEGIIRKAHLKDGKFLDAKLYALLAE